MLCLCLYVFYVFSFVGYNLVALECVILSVCTNFLCVSSLFFVPCVFSCSFVYECVLCFVPLLCVFICFSVCVSLSVYAVYVSTRICATCKSWGIILPFMCECGYILHVYKCVYLCVVALQSRCTTLTPRPTTTLLHPPTPNCNCHLYCKWEAQWFQPVSTIASVLNKRGFSLTLMLSGFIGFCSKENFDLGYLLCLNPFCALI